MSRKKSGLNNFENKVDMIENWLNVMYIIVN